MFDNSISPLAPMLTVRVIRSVWRFALFGTTLARLFCALRSPRRAG